MQQGRNEAICVVSVIDIHFEFVRDSAKVPDKERGSCLWGKAFFIPYDMLGVVNNNCLCATVAYA